MLREELLRLHKQLFAGQEGYDVRTFFAPGRVNLIGEHTDYNGGHVFPCALDIGTYAVVSKRNDQYIHVYSTNFSDSGIIKFDTSTKIVKNETCSWINYLLGVCKIFIDNGYFLPCGLNIVIGGNIPNGAGLSSSASIEMLITTVLNEMFNFNIPPLSMVRWGQMVENNFIGVSCGIMDQFASMMGKKEHALLLNCNTLQHQHANLKLGEYVIVISNTNKRRGLADSKYNERVKECQTALKQLQSIVNIANLADIDSAEFSKYQHVISDPTHKLRALHVVTENERTLKAADLLQRNNLIGFGKLMNESHISLRDNYAVTGYELDTLVAAAWQDTSCIGSRMTGAGFGGCTVSLVKSSETQNFINNVSSYYTQYTGLSANFYIAHPADGAREISQ